jgi:dUTP pyrophosphatase|tara:strand:+ start:2913 stop:3425 length:513 start_codon:yes stop_codon:yes gene_type:complete
MPYISLEYFCLSLQERIKKMIIEYYKTRVKVKDPQRANPSDAGLDVFYCPPVEEPVILQPGENKVLPTGLKFGIPHNYMLQVMNRSSMAAKKSLIVGAHCIDSGYDGEVFIDIHNIGREVQVVRPYDKIAQLVLVPVVSFRAQEVGDDILYKESITISARGDGALGSTGK